MRKDVFISHASADRAVAEQVCSALEDRDVSCWIAPRDIPPGKDYPEVIIDTIRSTKAMVLLLSEAANSSRHVGIELERALNYGRMIIPVRIQNVSLAKRLEYCASLPQWIDAWRPPLASHIKRLADSVKSALADDERSSVPHFHDLPIIDRQHARDVLARAGEQVAAHGKGGVVLIGGLDGIGKTRLLEWYLDELSQEHRVAMAWGAHEEHGGPWYGVRAAIEELLELRDAPRNEVRSKVAETIADTQSSENAEIDVLCEVLRPSVGEERAEGILTADQVVDCLVRILRRCSRTKPLILVLEDIQWADEQTLRLIQRVAGSVSSRPAPLSVWATLPGVDRVRPPSLEDCINSLNRHQGRTFEHLTLGPLTEDAARELANQAFPGGLTLPSGLIERAGGRPLFLIEMLRFLSTKRLVRREGSSWVIANPDAIKDIVPASIAALVNARVGKVSREAPFAVGVLRFAALLGERFRLDLLRAALAEAGEDSRQEAIEEALVALQEAGFLRAMPESDGWSIAFRQGLCREAVLSLPAVMGRSPFAAARAHHAIAAAKAEVYSERIAEVSLEIANHFVKAGEPIEAARHYLAAARHAVRSFCYENALALYEKAAQLEPNQTRAIRQALEALVEPHEEGFRYRALEILDRCVALSCGAKCPSTSLWESSTSALRPSLVACRDLVLLEEAETLLAFLVYAAQTLSLPQLWDDITQFACLLATAAEARGDVGKRTRLFDYLGYVGESLFRQTNVANDGASYALEAAQSYEARATAPGLTVAAQLPLFECASWCYGRAGRGHDGIRCMNQVMALVTESRLSGSKAGKAILAEGERTGAELLLQMVDDKDREARSNVVDGFRRAAAIRRESWPESWFASWIDKVADAIDRGSAADLDVPTDARPGEAIVVHNRMDAAAADIVMERLTTDGYVCVSTGPTDPRSPAQLAEEYYLVIIMGSFVAPGMERFSYVFQAEDNVWRLFPHFGEDTPYHSYWRRRKPEGDGEFVMIAGTTKIETALAAEEFAVEFAPLE